MSGSGGPVAGDWTGSASSALPSPGITHSAVSGAPSSARAWTLATSAMSVGVAARASASVSRCNCSARLRASCSVPTVVLMSTPTKQKVPSSTASPAFPTAAELSGRMNRKPSAQVARAVMESADQKPPYQAAAMIPARKMGKGTVEASEPRLRETSTQAQSNTATQSTWRSQREAGSP